MIGSALLVLLQDALSVFVCAQFQGDLEFRLADRSGMAA